MFAPTRPCSTLALAAACGGIGVPCAEAMQTDGGQEEVRAVLFGSLEAGRSGFLNAGGKFAPGGLTGDGFVAMGGLGSGLHTERDWGDREAVANGRVPRVPGTTTLAHALGGWQWARSWGVVALFAGPEVSLDTLDTSVPVRPVLRFGLRLHAEVWARPSDATLLTVTGITGTARGDGWGRISWGWRALTGYLGPEAALYADRTGYRKWSLGVHLTDVPVPWSTLEGLRARVSAGWLYEEQVRRPGLYLSACAWLPL